MNKKAWHEEKGQNCLKVFNSFTRLDLIRKRSFKTAPITQKSFSTSTFSSIKLSSNLKVSNKHFLSLWRSMANGWMRITLCSKVGNGLSYEKLQHWSDCRLQIELHVHLCRHYIWLHWSRPPDARKILDFFFS